MKKKILLIIGLATVLVVILIIIENRITEEKKAKRLRLREQRENLEDSIQLNYNKCKWLYLASRYNEALSCFQEFNTQLTPEFALKFNGHDLISFIYYINGDNKRAEEESNKAFSTSLATSSKAYLTRSLIKYSKGDKLGAIKDLEIYNYKNQYYKNNCNPIEYYEAGYLYIKLGYELDGCDYLSISGEMGYENSYDLIKIYCQF